MQSISKKGTVPSVLYLDERKNPKPYRVFPYYHDHSHLMGMGGWARDMKMGEEVPWRRKGGGPWTVPRKAKGSVVPVVL